MKKNIRVPVSLSQGRRGDGQVALFYPVAVSLVCHLVFLLLFVVSPSLRSERPPARSVINVSMVSLRNPSTETTENTPGGQKGPSDQKIRGDEKKGRFAAG